MRPGDSPKKTSGAAPDIETTVGSGAMSRTTYAWSNTMPTRNTNMPSAFSVDPSVYTSWPFITASQLAVLPAKCTERTLAESAAHMDFLGKRLQAGLEFAISLPHHRSPTEYAQAWMIFWTQAVRDYQQTCAERTARLASQITANVTISTCPTNATHPEELLMNRAA